LNHRFMNTCSVTTQADTSHTQDEKTNFTHKLTTRRERSSRRENLTSVLTAEQA
jgi:hypothetical protein